MLSVHFEEQEQGTPRGEHHPYCDPPWVRERFWASPEVRASLSFLGTLRDPASKDALSYEMGLQELGKSSPAKVNSQSMTLQLGTTGQSPVETPHMMEHLRNFYNFLRDSQCPPRDSQLLLEFIF